MQNKDAFSESGYWGFYKKYSKIECCFAESIGGCSGNISSAHSLQKIGILDQIEDHREGGKKIYSLENWIYDKSGKNIIDFKLVGKKSASIFKGFCDKHDIEIFAPIEQQPLTLTDEQLFLYYYRGFAHSHHNVEEQCKFKEYILTRYPVPSQPYLYRQYVDLTLEYRALKDICSVSKVMKIQLNKMLNSKDYSTMQHYYRVIPYKRITCSQRIVAPYTYSGISLKRWESISQVMLTIIPDVSRTIILFSYFNDDIKGIQFMDEIKMLNDNQFTHAISSILLYSGMNTFFAPSLWDSLDQYKKAAIIDDINYLVYYGLAHHGFYHSKVDLFD